MFRDSRGVVHTVCSSDPLADLPPGAALALQQALLEPTGPVDLGSVLERCDAVLELVERWQDAFFASLPDEVDLEEEARYAAEAGLSLDEVESGFEDDDDEPLPLGLAVASLSEDLGAPELATDLGPGEGGLHGLAEQLDDEAFRLLLPEELVAVLERELLLLPLRVRLEALVAAADLVGGWSDLVADQEKLLGHLVLAHGEAPSPTGHEELVLRHGRLHGENGPGHPGGPP